MVAERTRPMQHVWEGQGTAVAELVLQQQLSSAVSQHLSSNPAGLHHPTGCSSAVVMLFGFFWDSSCGGLAGQYQQALQQ